ncbi:MAG: glycosyltransferase family 4 protein [Hyphomicrobiales bacterium]|nr:glycosyltransferase family 4 protein [Hyphomicrobiales bacterium]
MRRWSINGDFTTLRPTGVARYARETTLALDALLAEGHPLAKGLALELLVPRPIDDPLALRAIPVRLVPEYSRPRLPQFWVQAQLPRHVEGGLLSFCNLAPVALKRQIVCIHDLHTMIVPESYSRPFRWVHRLILPALGRRAAGITTVSEFSRSQIAACGVAAARKVTVTYNGSDHAGRWEAARSNLGRWPDWPYVLCLGQGQRYKNMELLGRLAPVLARIGLDLWIAGDIAPDKMFADGKPANVRLIGRVGDDDLKAALAGALCFLFPSRIEGFGLPAVEAMAAGCPVVASTSPCLPEICGEAALYADPDDIGAWIECVKRLKDDKTLRGRLVAAGKAQASTYSWRRVAETYLELMASIDGIGVEPAHGSRSSSG